MSFLSNVEAFYLAILRVVILAAATLALIVVAVGTVRAVPAFTQQFAPSRAHEVGGANLGAFISERRAQGAETATVAADEPTQAKAVLPDNINAAAKALAVYAKGRLGLTWDVDAIARMFMEKRDSLPEIYQDAYGDGLRTLMSQLDRSTGQPLQPDEIDKLIQWHFDKFKVEAEADVAKRAADGAAGLQSIIAAGAAMLVFLLVVFCFIFVKIERNLRLVRTIDQSPKSLVDSAPASVV
jgi:hypothetical protein